MERRIIPGFSSRYYRIVALWGAPFALGVWAGFTKEYSTPWLYPVLIAIWAIGFQRQWLDFHRFVCPQCLLNIKRQTAEPGTRICFECPVCKIEWDTGFIESQGIEG